MSKTKDYEPRNLGTDDNKETKDIYKALSRSDYFKDRPAPNKDIFIYAMAIGFFNKKSLPLKKKYTGHVNVASLNDREKWLIKAIAISESKDLTILSGIDNQKKIFKIAEGYANGGLKLLHHQVLGSQDEDFLKKLEHKLKEMSGKKR